MQLSLRYFEPPPVETITRPNKEVTKSKEENDLLQYQRKWPARLRIWDSCGEMPTSQAIMIVHAITFRHVPLLPYTNYSKKATCKHSISLHHKHINACIKFSPCPHIHMCIHMCIHPHTHFGHIRKAAECPFFSTIPSLMGACEVEGGSTDGCSKEDSSSSGGAFGAMGSGLMTRPVIEMYT